MVDSAPDEILIEPDGLWRWNGMILARNGALAISRNCCCAFCDGWCYGFSVQWFPGDFDDLLAAIYAYQPPSVGTKQWKLSGISWSRWNEESDGVYSETEFGITFSMCPEGEEDTAVQTLVDHFITWAENTMLGVVNFEATCGAGGEEQNISVVRDVNLAILKQLGWGLTHQGEYGEEETEYGIELNRVLNCCGGDGESWV